MNEKWSWTHIIFENQGQRFMLKLLHYKCWGQSNREWYRVMPETFDITKTASSQPFGYGLTAEDAMKKFFATLEMHARSA